MNANIIFPSNEQDNNLTVQISKQNSTINTGDVTSYFFNETPIRIGDEKVDNFWTNIPQNPIDEWSTTTQEGWMKTVYDDFYIYVLIAHSYAAPWVAVELNATTDPSTSMALNNDGWVFGQGSKGPLGEPATFWEGDVHFNSNGVHPLQDIRNDLTYEYINDTTTNTLFIEMRRPLITNDIEGCDYPLVKNLFFNVKFASGISSATHKDGGNPHLFTMSTQPIQLNQTNTVPTTTVKIATPAEIKANNEFLLMTLTSAEMFFNFIVLTIIVLFHKKKD